jgi:hypothetical protein
MRNFNPGFGNHAFNLMGIVIGIFVGARCAWATWFHR